MATKKRVFIAVDKVVWEESQQILREIKIHPQFFNLVINTFLAEKHQALLKLRERQEAGEQISLVTFFKMVGNIGDLDGDQMRLV